jgi:tRNA (guanine26-N2/guanine27-N2)-dimethyltransferase
LFSKIRSEEKRLKYEKKLEKYSEKPHKHHPLPHSEHHLSPHNEHRPFPPSNGISILDALAATGLRSVRYLKEIPGVQHVVINDLDPKAIDAAKQSCLSNGIENSRVTFHIGDASMYMYEKRDPFVQFDVIDLDPYGTASPFLDSAVQAIADGGLLCVTCTDMPVLAGNYPEVCFAKYGCMPLKARYIHEMSLRILLHAIDTAANRYKRYIEPWLSLSVDFYVRVFVRIHESPAEVKRSSLKRAFVYQSTQCASFYLQPLSIMKKSITAAHSQAPNTCLETKGRLKIGGPFWSDPIHSQEVVDELLRRVEYGVIGSEDLPFPIPTANRVRGILTSISEELKDVPFYYVLPDISATLKCMTPNASVFKSALLNAGYRVSQFHHEPTAVKTDAPPHVVSEMIRLLFHMKILFTLCICV